jgi:hypothetical protein
MAQGSAPLRHLLASMALAVISTMLPSTLSSAWAEFTAAAAS